MALTALRARAASLALCSVVALAGLATPSLAQEGVTTGANVPEWVKRLAIDPESSQAKRYASIQKARVEKEKELRKLRLKHFGPIKKTEVRQEGILKLREYSDPALFAALIEIFGKEGLDVRTAVMDIFADSATPEGDTALTWLGIFDDLPEARAAAISRLQKRIKQEGAVPDGVRLATFEGIRSGKETAVASAANLAVELQMLEAIPWMIAGQVQTSGAQTGAGGERQGALAWIMVGTQTAFVSDLTPVVAGNAVAFDPTLSVVTEGVVLRVIDAAVVTYNFDLHGALKGLAKAGTGQNVDYGFDTPKWQDWYAKVMRPIIAEREAARANAAATPTNAGAKPDAEKPDAAKPGPG